MLNTVIYDGPGDRPLLIAHGLFGSARNWGVIAKQLAADRPVIVVDMRNHGQSPWLDSHSYADMAADLAGLLDGPADVLGHSMGGKAAMLLALTGPDLVARLIVADIAPITYAHDQMGPIAAMRRVDLDSVSGRADAKAQMGPLAPGVADFLLQSLDFTDRRWRLNLDVLADEMNRIIGWPDVTGQFDGPTLFVTGENSDYVPDSAKATINDVFTNATFAEIRDAGHWLHAEKPKEFVEQVDKFLRV